jgi:hypothetical protein
MMRRLFTLASALLLVLCVATMLLWIASYSSKFVVNWSGGTTSWDLVFSRGEISSSRFEWGGPTNLGWTLQVEEPRSLLVVPGNPWRVRFRAFGFALISVHKSKVFDGVEIVWPCWVFALLTVLSPLAWIIRKGRESKPGRCAVCSYDLRATPDRCPECGTPIPSKVEATA